LAGGPTGRQVTPALPVSRMWAGSSSGDASSSSPGTSLGASPISIRVSFRYLPLRGNEYRPDSWENMRELRLLQPCHSSCLFMRRSCAGDMVVKSGHALGTRRPEQPPSVVKRRGPAAGRLLASSARLIPNPSDLRIPAGRARSTSPSRLGSTSASSAAF
jgi:hypothetical protein